MKKANIRLRDRVNDIIDDYLLDYEGVYYQNLERLKQNNNIRAKKSPKKKKKKKSPNLKIRLKEQAENLCSDVTAKIRMGKIDQAVAIICEDETTGELQVDIVKAIFKVNKLAHAKDGTGKFFRVKNALLQYLLDNKMWGEPPFDSFGWGTDGNNKTVLYFDVPEYGQVSFHAKNVKVNTDKVPKYRYKWKKVENEEFPSVSKIDSYHDLMRYLNKETPDMLADSEETREETNIVNPINCKNIGNKEFECYLMDKDNYKKFKKAITKKNKKQINMREFEMKKAKFSIEDGLIEEVDCKEYEKKAQMDLLKSHYNNKKEIKKE